MVTGSGRRVVLAVVVATSALVASCSGDDAVERRQATAWTASDLDPLYAGLECLPDEGRSRYLWEEDDAPSATTPSSALDAALDDLSTTQGYTSRQVSGGSTELAEAGGWWTNGLLQVHLEASAGGWTATEVVSCPSDRGYRSLDR